MHSAEIMHFSKENIFNSWEVFTPAKVVKSDCNDEKKVKYHNIKFQKVKKMQVAVTASGRQAYILETVRETHYDKS